MTAFSQRTLWFGLLQMLRPANVVTSTSNVLAGIAFSYFLLSQTGELTLAYIDVGLLMLVSALLYAGGIVFNDVFDAQLDKIERPERAIPSGRVSLVQAMCLGLLCFSAAVWISLLININVAVIALSISILCTTYNAWAKHSVIVGPFNMGLCRAFNFLLGAALVVDTTTPCEVIIPIVWVSLLYLVYVAAITLISQEEVNAAHAIKIKIGALLYALIGVSMICVLIHYEMNWLHALPFYIFFLFSIYKPIVRALQQMTPQKIGLCVREGVLGIVIFDAAWVAASTHVIYGLLTLLLLFISSRLAKYFAVT